MLGAITGDIIGSRFEWDPARSVDFPLFQPSSRFTDDTVLTIATADAILRGVDYAACYRSWGRRYPDAGYGGTFSRWLGSDDMGPYNSWGNGSAMRVSPVGWAFSAEDEVLREAEASARVTHDHPEGVKGAQAVALAIFLARSGTGKTGIRDAITGRFGYDLDRTIDAIRPGYRFDVSCQGSVPEAIIAFLESDSFEEAVRLAISLGGDADTQAAIAGSIAEAHYGEVPKGITDEVLGRLPAEMVAVYEAFRVR